MTAKDVPNLSAERFNMPKDWTRERVNAVLDKYGVKREEEQVKCLGCGVNLSSEWEVKPDDIQLCHLCYEKEYQPLCGDHLVPLGECWCRV